MKRSLLLLLLLLPFVCNAQMKLEVTESGDEGGVYACEDRNEMKAIFYCDSSLILTFKSAYDDIISQEEVYTAGRKAYEIVFPTDGRGTSYDGRILEIYCDGFDVFTIFDFNFPKSTLKEFQVTNKYIKAKNPYYKSVYSGDDLFSNAMYDEAKHQYLICKEFPEYETYKQSVDRKIEAIDSILKWRDLAEELFASSKYLDAYKYYNGVLKMNPEDLNVQGKLQDCITRYQNDCQINFSMAEDLYYNKERKKALEYYNKVLEMGCQQASAANEKVILIKNELSALSNHDRFLVYEWNKDVNIGLSYGKCIKRKVGGYFTLRVNPEILEFPKSEKDPTKYGEANLSFGLTRRIIRPFWFFVGVGYTGGGSFIEDDDKLPGESSDDIDYKLDWYHAFSPEVGAIIKFWHITLKYTFQYRYTFNNESADVLGDKMHFVGAGFCW